MYVPSTMHKSSARRHHCSALQAFLLVHTASALSPLYNCFLYNLVKVICSGQELCSAQIGGLTFLIVHNTRFAQSSCHNIMQASIQLLKVKAAVHQIHVLNAPVVRFLSTIVHIQYNTSFLYTRTDCLPWSLQPLPRMSHG